MKVTAIAHNYIPDCRGGAEIMLHQIMVALAKAGCTVEVLVPNTRVMGKKHCLDGVTVVTGMAAKQKLGSVNANVIISHLLEAPRAKAIAATKKCKFVNIIHNDNASTLIDMASGADLFIFNTNWLQAALNKPGIVVHPPVFPEQHKTERGSRITLVNLIPEKGCELFYRLADALPNENFLAVQGGYGKQIVKSSPNILHQANTGDMKGDVWSKTSILIMPSVYESYGMVGIEAMASGIPVVAHPTPGLVESLGYAGTFVDRDDFSGWVKAISDIRQYPEIPRAKAISRSGALDSSAELNAMVSRILAL